MVTGVPPSTPPPVAQVHPAPAVQAPKPAPTPDAQPPAQAQNEAGSRSLLTPIVD
jgi:hypothetical protein